MSIEITQSDLTRIVVAVDPATTANEDSDDTGIVVVARGPHQPSTCKVPFCPGHGYVLDDRSCHESPATAMRIAVRAYDDWKADRVVAETNNGGDYIGDLLHTIRAGIPYATVTATRGKRVRAEPVAALWEQGRGHFIYMGDSKLEDQLTTWSPDMKDSPDRLDALVWGMTYLGLVGGQGDAFITAWKNEITKRPAHEEPIELRMLPRQASNAPSTLRKGCKHRFQREPNGIQCLNCGGWQLEGEP